MKIAVAYTHHRRCGPYFYARALRQLGHEVVTVGPWWNEMPFGTHGRQADIDLPRTNPQHYEFDAIGLPWRPDAFLLIDGGENLRVHNIPAPWAHISTEGTNMDWSDTPHKYAEIMCNGADPTKVQWLPKAFEPSIWSICPSSVRSYNLVQLASAREARVHVWGEVQRKAPDLSVFFGDIWGPVYDVAYAHSVATYACSTLDFVTTRVFEAMAVGCVVIADRNPSMLKLFTDNAHFIGFDPVPAPGGEGMPDVDWLIDTVRMLSRDQAKRTQIATTAWHEVTTKHSYTHRMERVLSEMGL